MTRNAFTIVEMIIAMLVGVIAMTVAFNAIILLTRGERSTDRAATKALTDARLMSQLNMDVRSSQTVTPNGQDEFTVVRYFAGPGGQMQTKKVTWKTYNDPKNPRVTRQVEGESRAEEFSYRGQEPAPGASAAPQIDPLSPSVKFKIERLDTDVHFPPSAP